MLRMPNSRFEDRATVRSRSLHVVEQKESLKRNGHTSCSEPEDADMEHHGRSAYDSIHEMKSQKCAPRLAVAILGVVDTTCAGIVAACQQLAIPYKLFTSWKSLLRYDGSLEFHLLVVQKQALEVPLRELINALQETELRRTVLLGPTLGGSDYIEALHDGCDEVWPVNIPSPLLSVLLQKAWATTQQSHYNEVPDVVSFGCLMLFAHSGRCRVRDKEATLGRVCFAILQCLARRHSRVVSRRKISSAMGRDFALENCKSRTVDMGVSRLRKKLGAAGIVEIWIEAVDASGYRLNLHAEPGDFEHNLLAARAE